MTPPPPTPPAPVPQREYIDHLWRSVEEGLITWADLNDLQATWLRDQVPVLLPTIEEIRGKR